MRRRIKLGALALAGGTAAMALIGGPALASSQAAKAVTGPEIVAGSVYGKAALANVTRIPLLERGLVYSHSIVVLGGGSGPQKGSEKSLSSPAGKLTVMVASKPTSSQSFDAKTCHFGFTEEIPVSVVGAKSTGAFAGASGPGAVQVHFGAFAPRYKSGPHKGQCNTSSTAPPLAKGAVASFIASFVLTTD